MPTFSYFFIHFLLSSSLPQNGFCSSRILELSLLCPDRPTSHSCAISSPYFVTSLSPYRASLSWFLFSLYPLLCYSFSLIFKLKILFCIFGSLLLKNSHMLKSSTISSRKMVPNHPPTLIFALVIKYNFVMLMTVRKYWGACKNSSLKCRSLAWPVSAHVHSIELDV